MKSHQIKEDVRIALLEQSIVHLEQTLNRINNRFENIDKYFLSMERKLDLISQEMRQGFDKFNSRIWTNFYWTLGAMAALGAIIGHGFEWF